MKLCDTCEHWEQDHWTNDRELGRCNVWETSSTTAGLQAIFCDCPQFEYDDFAHWVRDQRAAHHRTRHGKPVVHAQNSGLRQFLAINRWERQKR